MALIINASNRADVPAIVFQIQEKINNLNIESSTSLLLEIPEEFLLNQVESAAADICSDILRLRIQSLTDQTLLEKLQLHIQDEQQFSVFLEEDEFERLMRLSSLLSTSIGRVQEVTKTEEGYICKCERGEFEISSSNLKDKIRISRISLSPKKNRIISIRSLINREVIVAIHGQVYAEEIKKNNTDKKKKEGSGTSAAVFVAVSAIALLAYLVFSS